MSEKVKASWSLVLLLLLLPLASPLTTPSKVLAVGEALFDSLPNGIFLGGAPSNVAVHLAELGVTTTFASRVGADQLGEEISRRLSLRGVGTDLIQTDDQQRRTGFVTATLDERGDASYTFNTPAAWDVLEPSEGLLEACRACEVLIIGSLASRLSESDGGSSKGTIEELAAMAAASEDTELVLDVNLRAPWYSATAVLALARSGVGLLKLNEEELEVLEGWLRDEGEQGEKAEVASVAGAASRGGARLGASSRPLRDRVAALGVSLGAARVCVTRAERGAALWCRGGLRPNGLRKNDAFVESAGFADSSGASAALAAGAADTVGAGDAFLAALVAGLLVAPADRPLAKPLPPARALDSACALGAFVASRPGALPKHDAAPPALRGVFSAAGGGGGAAGAGEAEGAPTGEEARRLAVEAASSD